MSDRRYRNGSRPVSRAPARGAAFCAFAVALAACGDSAVGPVVEPGPAVGPIDLSAAWVESPPAAVGLDPVRLSAAVEAAESTPRLRSLLVVKSGRLAVERYYGGFDRGSLHDVRSVTKSIVATLAAIAQAEGHIGSLDDRIETYLTPEVATLSADQRSITIRHLLSMTGGFQWDESGGLGDYSLWIQSADHIQTLLARPVINTPGTGFVYNSAAVHLLGVVIEEAVGEPLSSYADRVLFQPAGIRPVRWESLSRGYVNGGSGIDLRARDLARLGQLYLQQGVSGARRVLPEGWVAAATSPKFGWRASYGSLDRYTYGYLWWISEGEPETAYLAWGYGGQFVYVVPDLELVVVITTDWRRLSQEGGPGPLERAMLDVLIEGVHQAAR